MSYNYTTFVDALKRECRIVGTNAAFTAILPSIIDSAEQMIYRDLDLLATIVTNSSGTTTPNQREFLFPITFRVLQSINILNGTSRTPCTKISREVMDMLYPDSTAPSVGSTPTKYAPLTDQSILLGPSPGNALSVECIGTIVPATLSAVNPTTFLSTMLSDLFLDASMIYAAGYQQNFGKQADNPQMAVSWAELYKQKLPNARGEETARKYQAFGSA